MLIPNIVLFIFYGTRTNKYLENESKHITIIL